MQINPDAIIKNKILIPCAYTRVQQVGIDLTLVEEVELRNGASLNVLLNETVKLPKDIFATFTHRSTFNRKGIFITGSIYDPGYEGQVGCTIYNLSGSDITITENERIGQMVFFKADPASEYQGQYQGEHLNGNK
jgi:deoxycytidine triphosphate deaminase